MLIRGIIWFNKSDEKFAGNVQFTHVSLSDLQKQFGEVEDDPMYNGYAISEEHLPFLSQYTDLTFDFSKYDYFLDCSADRTKSSLDLRILEKAACKILSFVLQQQLKVETENSLYWQLDETEQFDNKKKPKRMKFCDLLDDWLQLQKIADGEVEPTIKDLFHLSSIERYIGSCYSNDKVQ